jgi:hypothetical protein
MIAIASADDLDFIEDTHTYLESGKVRVSCTQALTLAGLIDFSMVPEDVLMQARDRGIGVHLCTEYIDRHGHCDPTWITEEYEPYVEAWHRFKRDSRLYIKGIEERRIAQLGMVRYGMTYDRHGFIGPAPALIDIKTGMISPVAGLQLAMYESGLTGHAWLGYFRRLVVQLRRDGTYRLHDFADPADLDIARTVLHFTHGLGDLDHHNAAIDTWARNHGVKRAA